MFPSIVLQVALAVAAFAPAPKGPVFEDPLPPGAVGRLGSARYRQPTAGAIEFTRDGKQLISGGPEGCVLVWDWRTGKEVRRFGRHGTYIHALALDNRGKWLITCSVHPDTDVCIWDFATGK